MSEFPSQKRVSPKRTRDDDVIMVTTLSNDVIVKHYCIQKLSNIVLHICR